jgi:hypothetical protein
MIRMGKLELDLIDFVYGSRPFQARLRRARFLTAATVVITRETP